ncbi:MAG: LysR family transcriptional regulator [Clostridia bacterium]|nr:LysR family transcriptional regulator [Clostridia bacterium]MBR6523973.1 LysR family transcriptional regulator [Clostridia bacterium]
MNSRQLQYTVVLAEVCSFSQAAQKFKISQPAFSKQIIALENELRIKLFDRTTTPLSLTIAGEVFVEKAKKILFEEETLLKTMEQYKSGEFGKLVIGISPVRSLCIMPQIVSQIKDTFPNLNIVLKEHSLAELRNGLFEGSYDFAIINLPVDEKSFEVIPLKPDAFVLAVPNKLLHLIDKNPDCENFTEVDLSDCKKLPFVVLGKSQEMRKIFDSLCAKAKIEPNIFVEVTGVTTAREMVKAGVAATIIPKQFLLNEAENKNITLLELKQSKHTRRPAIVLRRGQYISKYAEFAIELLKNK